MKAAADVVVHTAVHHGVQGVGGHGQQGFIARPFVFGQRQLEAHGRRKLGGGAESPVFGVVACSQMAQRAGYDCPVDGGGALLDDQVMLKRPDRAGDPPGLFDQVIAPGVPGLVQQV